jgi:glutamate/tyrosine decarboxylase-like PLP-dependent enzyme
MSSPENPKAPLFIVPDRTTVLRLAAESAQRYLAEVNDRPVTPNADAVVALNTLTGALPEQPTSSEDVVHLLAEMAGPATVANNGGRYFGFVHGGTLPAAMGAAWLVAAWDQNAAFQVQSPAAIALESTALEWVKDLLGLPAGSGGAVVTGATMANFCGLAAARHALLERGGWDVESDGLFGAPPLRVVVSDEVHASLLKALALLGFGRERVIRVPVDDQGRMKADAVPALDHTTILCLQAGNVNTGAFDPADKICAKARRAGAWVHVDGAFGLWATVSPRLRPLTAGFDLADSWATDGHKWPNIGYDCGIALIREPETLRAAMAISASYLVQGTRHDPSHSTPESSRRARGVELWAGLRSLGRKGLAELVERTVRHAKRFAAGLTAAGYRVLNDVVLNQVLVSFGSAEKTQRTIERIQQQGMCWCGSTVWQGHTAMRISVSNWSTTEADVEMSLEAMLAAAAES